MKDFSKESSPKYGRKQLLIIAFIIFAVSTIMIIGGTTLFVKGCISHGAINIIWKIIIGVLLVLFGGTFGWVSILMFFTAKSLMKVPSGNIKVANDIAMGTANALLCDKCGEELEVGSTFCTKCGKEVDSVIKCECGEVNSSEAEFCKKCGKNLK